MIKEMENKAKEEANRKAKDYVVTAIQKCAADHVSETTISVDQRCGYGSFSQRYFKTD